MTQAPQTPEQMAHAKLAADLAQALQNDYSDSPCAVVECGGEFLAVKVVRDSHPCNPWEERDCQPPIVARFGRDDSARAEKWESPDILDFWDYVPPEKLRENWQAICKAFEWGHGYLEFDTGTIATDLLALRESLEYRRENGISPAEETNACLVEWLKECGKADRCRLDYIENLATVLDLCGWPCHQWESRGYCQGDWASCIMVATPEWVKECGLPVDLADLQPGQLADLKDNLAASATEFDAWAWGDVYGYDIESMSGAVEHDSCGGFYGQDYDKSGLAGAAAEWLDGGQVIDWDSLLDTVLNHYLAAAEFADSPESGHYVFSPEFEESAKEDCRAFLLDMAGDNLAGAVPLIMKHPAQAGHDFWLTRQGHGAGFWDCDRGQYWAEFQEALSAYAERFGVVYDIWIESLEEGESA